MFINYLAGVASIMLAVSSFIPWVTVWFYSLRGIESIFGVGILVVGLISTMVSIFQHLSGKMRGRAFIFFAIIALFCEGFYFRKLVTYGSKLNEIVGLLTDIFGDALLQKIQQLFGEQWTKILGKIAQRFNIDTSLNSFDFVGGGLVLATLSTLALLIIGILLEKNRSTSNPI